MDNSLEEIFRTNLRFYRQRAKLSQEKLSAKLDKNINYINMIEGKKSIPPLSMIEQIASILKIPSYYLLKPLDEEHVLDRNKKKLAKLKLLPVIHKTTAVCKIIATFLLLSK